MRSPVRLAALVCLGLTGCAPSGAAVQSGASPTRAVPMEAVVDTGRINGAPYRIDVPARWNGGLVMYAHGYDTPSPRGHSVAAGGPGLRDVFLRRGFAIAQSGYRTQGWAVAEAIEDNEALRRHFIARHGRPDSTFVAGHSMGGHITVATIERFPEHYDGALPLCGPLSPALDFFDDALFDLLVSFDHLFPRVLPVAGLADANGPPMVAPQGIEAALKAEPEKAGLLAQRFGIRPPQLAGVVSFYYAILKELQGRAGGNPFDNTGTVYGGFGDDAAFNRGVRRYTATPEAVAYLRRNYTPTGRIVDPVLSVHTTYDPIVAPSHVNQYAVITGLAGTQDRFVGRYVVADGHCAITPAQIGSAFDALRAWARTGTRPAGGELR